MARYTQDPKERYTKWHSWGKTGGNAVEPTKLIELDGPGFPPDLVAMGELHELHVEPADTDQTEIIDFTDLPGWAAFDPAHPQQRIHLWLPETQKKWMVENYLDLSDDADWWDLKAVAAAVGGRHAQGGYPAVKVQPIGPLSHITYYTEKVGDGHSQYIHEFGEESDLRPWLAVDASGNIFVAAGNYTSPYAGITD